MSRAMITFVSNIYYSLLAPLNNNYLGAKVKKQFQKKFKIKSIPNTWLPPIHYLLVKRKAFDFKTPKDTLLEEIA